MQPAYEVRREVKFSHVSVRSQGWYAACGHTGGLSCFDSFSQERVDLVFFPDRTRYYPLFTARVRSTREGNVLTPVCVSVHTCGGGGGTPSQDLRSRGGTPSQVWLGGGAGGSTPSQAWIGWIPPRHGVHPPRPGMGYPPPRHGTGYPPRHGMGYPPRDGMGYPPQTWDGVPPPGHGTGYPPSPRQISIASTCYAAGGMPLAFTQEDFLVLNIFSERTLHYVVLEPDKCSWSDA